MTLPNVGGDKMNGMDVRRLRMRLGEKYRADKEKCDQQAERLNELHAKDPNHYQMYHHLWGAQWYRGGPISKGELADMLYVSERTVERWEAGESTPHKREVAAMEALGGSA